MNLSKPLSLLLRSLHVLFLRCRIHLPKQQSSTFKSSSLESESGINPVYVINLDRQPERWKDILRELGCILDASGKPLSEQAIRYSACDALKLHSESVDNSVIKPYYTLGDQLFVEPQPDTLPGEFDLTQPVKMSKAEIAVALSHIGIWEEIAKSDFSYALILEDDVWFGRDFSRTLDQAWREMKSVDLGSPKFDILYVSYKEVRYGAPKELVSENVFSPERGLWYLSGYVLSKKGAQALIGLLPAHGPIDLWINHVFHMLDVRALRKSVVTQRRDLTSTNSYSILPSLTRIGILNTGDSALFHHLPMHFPVFVFGSPGSGLSSIAMALLMLGYRCCSDLNVIPKCEFDNLLSGRGRRIFNAYVNIGSLESNIAALSKTYPKAKFIVMGSYLMSKINDISAVLRSADVLYLQENYSDHWRELCEHLKLAPPNVPYPVIQDIGQRECEKKVETEMARKKVRFLKHDPSPWVAIRKCSWDGITVPTVKSNKSSNPLRVVFEDNFLKIDSLRWISRNDTFPGNNALFRPSNIVAQPGGGVSFSVVEEPLGVRDFSAAAISTRESFLFGRFEATFQATNVPGLVSGFFLHRDSPRQEIDVEITGNQPDRLVVNVFYNPGTEGAKFDYGYRGTPVAIPLGFDASKAFHSYAIEWDACEIRWYVDGQLVHRRNIWNPTPIPDLPMTLHFNTWPTRSKEFAGNLSSKLLPAAAVIQRVSIDASLHESLPLGIALNSTISNIAERRLVETYDSSVTVN